MADEFDDATDGRLVIATDDERMDCTESTLLSNEHNKSGTSALDQKDSSKGTTKREFDTLADGCPVNDGQNCWEVDSSHLVSNDAVDSKGSGNEGAENTSVSLERVQRMAQSADLVKWEELEGGVVPPSEGKSLENEQSHFVNESKKSTPITLQSHNQQPGVHNFVRGVRADSKKRKLMLDKGTCVLSRHTGVYGLDEHLLTMRPGTNLTIDITIICKAGSNTLYISAKWKGREYHGILTDGEPLFSHTYAQKRNAAQNAEKFAFESGTGNNNGCPASQKTANPEKAGGGGITGKRGGKRGVGGHSKGGGSEKRTKNYSAECQGGGNAEDESARQGKSENKGRAEAQDELAEKVELSATAGRHQPEEKAQSTHPHGHCQQHRRRRTSSSASSGICAAAASKSGLYDGDAVSRMRCPHQQCGHRFETANELNTHLLIGTHGVAGTKAKIFESTASQTPPVLQVSVGCDPCFSSAKSLSKGVLLCSKCQKELAVVDGSDEGIRSQPFESDGNDEKSKQKGATDNSPGFSDISDDAAPTLEKEESFDKQNDESKKASVSSTPAVVPSSSSSSTLNRTGTGEENSAVGSSPHQQNAGIDNGPTEHKNNIDTTCKSVAAYAPTTARQTPLTPQAVKSKSAEEFVANGSTKPAKKTSSTSAVSTIAKTPSTTAAATGGLGEPSHTSNDTNPYLVAPTSEMAAANAVASAFPFNHFLPFGPHLSQAFVSALGQGGTVPFVAPSSAAPLVPSSAALSAGLKLMSSPSAAGLLSLGTPLVASASQMPNCSGAPSKSAEPPPISQPIQHKIYELQQQQSGALLGRSSSTKPSISSLGHAQSVGISTSGALGGASNASSTVDMALMRPNSAISSIGHLSQQQQVLQSSSVQMMPQSNRQCPPSDPSPVGSSAPIGSGVAAVGSVAHHLPAPPLHHTFFPPLSSMIGGAGAQFGIPTGSGPAPNILAAAAQQHQQQMAAALRRNNSTQMGQSGASTHQQQQTAVAAAQHPNASLMSSFLPQGQVSPEVLMAAASNFDLNALQQYAAATLFASTPSSADGLGNAPPVGQQQHHQSGQK